MKKATSFLIIALLSVFFINAASFILKKNLGNPALNKEISNDSLYQKGFVLRTTNSLDSFYKIREELYGIFQDIDTIYQEEDFYTLRFLGSLLADTYSDNEDYILDKVIRLHLPVKFVEPGSAPDGFYGYAVQAKFDLLKDRDDYDKIYDLILPLYNDYDSIQLPSLNYYLVLELYRKALSFKLLSSNENDTKLRYWNELQDIFEKRTKISNIIYGTDSTEYAKNLIERSNLFLGMGPEDKMDLSEGKELLTGGFQILTSNIQSLYDLMETENLLNQKYYNFDMAEAQDDFIRFADKLLELNEIFDPENYLEQQKFLLNYNKANAYRYSNREDLAYPIFLALLSNLQEWVPDYYKGQLLQEIGLHLFKNQSYPEALPYLKEAESLGKDPRILSYIADCYEKIGDKVKAKEYDDKRLALLKSAIYREYNNLPTYVDSIDEKIRAIIEYCDATLEQRDLEETKNYAKYGLAISEDPENQFQLLRLIGAAYILESRADSATFYTMQQLELSKNDPTGWKKMAATASLSNIYERLSIEPELSLKIRLDGLEDFSNYVFSNKDKMMKAQYITSADLVIHEWQQAAEQCDYLGDSDLRDYCHEKILEYLTHIDDHHYDWEKYFSTYQYYWDKITGLSKETPRDSLLIDDLCLQLKDYYIKNKTEIDSLWPNFNYSTISSLYSLNGDTVNSRHYLELYKNETLDKFGENSPQYYEALDDELFMNLNNSEKKKEIAIELNRIAQNIEDKDKIIRSLNWLAETYKKEDEGKYLDILHQINALVTPEDPFYIINSILLQQLLQKGYYNKAAQLYPDVLSYIKSHIIKEFRNSTSKERESLWEDFNQVPFTTGEAFYEAGFMPRDFTFELYNNLLFRKNLLLNNSIAASNFLDTHSDSLLFAKNKRVERLKNQLKTNQDSIFDNGRWIPRNVAQTVLSRFENEIIQRASIIGDYTQGITTDLQQVYNSLPDDGVAIEFTRYISFDSIPKYAALVIDKNMTQPEFIPIALAEEIEVKNVNSKADRISGLIWENLRPLIKDNKNVFFSPDGFIHNLPIEYFYGDSAVRFTRLSSTAELKNTNPTQKNNRAVIYGGIDYSTDMDYLALDAGKYPSLERDFEISALPDSTELRDKISFLPYTLQEADTIYALLVASNIVSQEFTGKEASESSFKSLSGKDIDIVHIATHGFYWDKRKTDQLDYGFLNNNENSGAVMTIEEVSLSRSGLLFSGAQNVITGIEVPHNVDDGILTSEELSHLNLKGIDLIVLSACQTGLGDINTDGVYGLQRGLKKAGANALMLSLWKVDDKATQLLMTKFYENLVAGKSKREALLEAQDYLRNFEELRGETIIHPYQHPRYWSAFILLDAI